MTTQLPFTMSKHALDRALEMNVTGVEIRTCFEHPTEDFARCQCRPHHRHHRPMEFTTRLAC